MVFTAYCCLKWMKHSKQKVLASKQKKKPQDKQSKNYMAKTVYEKPWRWLLFYCHVERWNEMLLHMYMLIK